MRPSVRPYIRHASYPIKSNSIQRTQRPYHYTPTPLHPYTPETTSKPVAKGEKEARHRKGERERSHQAPVTSLSPNSHRSPCNPSNTILPSSVNSGLPSGVTAPTKNLGFHSTPLSSLSFAFARCFSSSSCFRLVARENCRAVMASVTPDQKRRLSLGSCCEGGGRILGATVRGARSIRGMRGSYSREQFIPKQKGGLIGDKKWRGRTDFAPNEKEIFSFQLPDILASTSFSGTSRILTLSFFSGSYLNTTPSNLFCVLPSQPSSI
jgi:hypothetical protein